MDTHAFLWWGENNPKLSALAQEIISDADYQMFLSVVSAWEIAIKASLGKLKNVPPSLESFLGTELLNNGFEILPVGFEHVMGVYNLPYHHNDPFDRLLIAQAKAEDLPLLSKDKAFGAYPVIILW